MKKDDLVEYCRKYGKREFDYRYYVIDAVVGDTIVATEGHLDDNTVKQEQFVFTKRANGRFYLKGDGMQQHEQCGLGLVTDVDTHCDDIGYRITDRANGSLVNKTATFKLWRQRKGDWNAYYERSIQARLVDYNKYMDQTIAKAHQRVQEWQDKLAQLQQRQIDGDSAMTEDDFADQMKKYNNRIRYWMEERNEDQKLKAMHGVFDRNNYTLWEEEVA